MRLKWMAGVFAVVGLCLGGIAQAASLTITITNTTAGMYFKELLIAAHTPANHMFESGYAASPGLEELAECGRQATLAAMMGDAMIPAAVLGVEECAALELLAPGDSVTCEMDDVDVDVNSLLSIAGRLMATNDGFVGLEALVIPVEGGTYFFPDPDSPDPAFPNLLGFDAGTEANTEVLGETIEACSLIDSSMPDLPGEDGGSNGTGASGSEGWVVNSNIHVHRGILGDYDLTGGRSDLDPTKHRWTNPIGTVEITVTVE